MKQQVGQQTIFDMIWVRIPPLQAGHSCVLVLEYIKSLTGLLVAALFGIST
jgi:hypothetical protein